MTNRNFDATLIWNCHTHPSTRNRRYLDGIFALLETRNAPFHYNIDVVPTVGLNRRPYNKRL